MDTRPATDTERLEYAARESGSAASFEGGAVGPIFVLPVLFLLMLLPTMLYEFGRNCVPRWMR